MREGDRAESKIIWVVTMLITTVFMVIKPAIFVPVGVGMIIAFNHLKLYIYPCDFCESTSVQDPEIPQISIQHPERVAGQEIKTAEESGVISSDVALIGGVNIIV